MVRSRWINMVKYGYFREAVDTVEELNRLLREKGLREVSCWTPVGGISNQIIMEFEYQTLADYEREGNAFETDADIMKVWRGSAEYFIDGSGREELIVTAPALA